MASKSRLSKLEIKLIVAGKMLLRLPASTPDLLNVLSDIEDILSGVQQAPSKSIINAMPPIIEAMIANELVKHPDMDVNISVSSCICEVLRITAPESPYNKEQMKDFFELVVITFEKLSSVSGGCYTKMTKVLKLFSNVRLAVLMLDLDQVPGGLVNRLFKQFLTVADSNSSAVVHEMEKIMTMIIEEGEDLTHELRDLIATSVKNAIQIASPLCVQLGEKVLMNCAGRLKPQLPDMGRDTSIDLHDYSNVVECICKNSSENNIMEGEETIPLTGEISKLRKDTTHKIKDGSLEAIRRCQNENKTLTYDDPPLPSKSVTDVKGKRKRENTPLKKQAQPAEHGENLVEIKVRWLEDKEFMEGVVKVVNSTKKKQKLLCNDGDKELLELKSQKRELVQNMSSKSDCKAKEIIPLTTERSILRKDTAVKCRQHKKKTVSFDIPLLPSKSVAKVKGTRKRNNTPMKKQVLHDDNGYEETLNLKRQNRELVENVSSKSDYLEPPLPKKDLSPQSDIICVRGYNVKNNIAPILEAIFKKHGDIAAKCVYKLAAVRTSFLELICEVVRQIQTGNITTVISEMEDIECQVSEAEAANIDVSWIRAHLSDIAKTKEAVANSTFLTEMKASTISVKRAAQMDLKESREELLAAQERFEKAERCVKAIDLVENKLSKNILELEAEKHSSAKQLIL